MTDLTHNTDFSDTSHLIEVVRTRLRLHPDRTVLRFLADGEQEHDSLTFRQLDEAARSIAAELQSRRMYGERVLLAYPQGLEFAAAFFGCLYAGTVAVPAYAPRRRGRDGRLAAIVRDAKPQLAMTSTATLASIKSSDRQQDLGVPWIASDRINASQAVDWEMPEVDRSTLAFLQYTSGSTAQPKGVMVSHGNLLVNSQDLDLGWEHTDDSLIVSWLPLFHDLGLIYGMLQPVYRGICGVLMPPVSFMKEPLRWLKAMTIYRGTHSAAPNFAYDLCVDRISADQMAALDLTSWRMSLNAAEPIRAATLERFAEHFAPCGFSAKTLTPGYGLAECTLKAAADRASEDYRVCWLRSSELAVGRIAEAPAATADSQPIVACGRSEVDTDIVIVDPITRLTCPADRVGEIWIRGASVAQGYWQREKETENTFQAYLADSREGPYLRTGDLGFVLRGRVYVTGRIKDLMIIRGLNIYPQDIELTVGQADESFVRNGTAAFSVEVADREELVVVQEIRRTAVRSLDGEGASRIIRRGVMDEHELRTHSVVLVRPGRIPKTSSGKVQRQLCRSMFLKGELESLYEWRSPEAIAPADFVQSPRGTKDYLRETLARQTRTPVEQIDPSRPFSDYGLDSLMAAEWTFQLEDHWSQNLDPTIFWTYSNIDSLAAYLDGLSRPQTTISESLPVHPRHVREDAIAIVGMACRFPGEADSPNAYWELLREARDAIGEIPADRWDVEGFYDSDPDAPGKYYTRHGGFLDCVDQFDAGFFHITPREAEEMDPQQRLLLEVAWEALENAAIAPTSLGETETGIFVGVSTDDYAQRSQRRSAAEINSHCSLGISRSIAAGRIAYFLGTNGPAVQLDTACSSSLMAVHHACQSLRTGECQFALAGGVNLILDPTTMIALCKLRALAADGRCKPFDAHADGYVRGEGCGVVALKRLKEATMDGDRILAIIRASAANHDGASNGLTAPNKTAQERLLRKAVALAGIAPNRLDYVEAHGTGTSLGDPIELDAVHRVYGHHRSKDRPLYIGSVKANLGHLEAAAGMAGLIKAVLVLQHGEVPAQRNFSVPNPHLAWEDTALVVPKQNTPWPSSTTPRLAAVSAFGFSGTNVHLILQSSTAEQEDAGDRDPFAATDAVEPAVATPRLVPLSAQSQEALLQSAARCGQWLEQFPKADLVDVACTSAVGRDHHQCRIAVLARTCDELRERLSAFAAGRTSAGVAVGDSESSGGGKVAFLFTGQGTPYVGMSRGLYASQKVFRETIERCHQALDGRLDIPLLDLLYSETSSSRDRLVQTANAQPALFAVQVSLAELWRSWGIEPTAVLGHSVGEYAAACVAGVFGLEDGIRMVAERGRLMQSLPASGGMFAVLTDLDRVAAAIEPYRDEVSIAAINGPENIVISGDRKRLQEIATNLEAAGVKSLPLQVSHAFHSPQIESMLEPFSQVADRVRYGQRTLRYVSCVTGLEADAALSSPEYWMEHTRRPVQFAQAVETLRRLDCENQIELGPKPTLLSLARRCTTELPTGCRVPSLQPDADDLESMLDSLAQLYVQGLPVDWQGVYADTAYRRVPLPTYPFQRRRYWLSFEPQRQPVAPKVAAVDWLPRPAEVAAELGDVLPGMEDANRQLRPRLDEIALRFMVQTVSDLNGSWQVGTRFSPAALARQLPERHRPKLRRMLAHLVQRGLLKQVRNHCCIECPVPTPDATQLVAAIERERSVPEVTLLSRAGRQLTNVLRGEVEALSLLFPAGSTDEAATFYSDAPLFREYNRLAALVLQRIVQRLPANENLRLLEIGAGTGGLTTHVLPELPQDCSEYLFTDLSPLFLEAARRRFADYSCLQTATLNICQRPEENGLEPFSFDIVLAANVLHATPRLRETLANVRRLLKPKGWLLLLEGTNPPLWGDMIFALIDGWWAFQDRDLRPDYPLLPADRWLVLLQEAGFTQAVELADQGDPGDSMHSLLLAQAALADSPTPSPGTAASLAMAAQPPAQREPAAKPPTERPEIKSVAPEDLAARIREHASRVMRMAAKEVDPSASLIRQGMDSLMMIEFRTIVEDETDVELDMGLLTSEPTIERIADHLREQMTIGQLEDHKGVYRQPGMPPLEASPGGGDLGDLSEYSATRHVFSRGLIRLQPEGSLPPLFFVPAGYGDNFAFQQVAKRLGFDRPVYGMQPPGGRQIKPLRNLTIFQLISIYLEQIKRIQPSGPYYLAGYSAGGIIALELARELLRIGDQVALLAEIDPPARVPAWLDVFYTAAYSFCEHSRLSRLIRQSGGPRLRRLFHAVLDEGLRTHTSVVRGHSIGQYPGQIVYFRARNSWVSLLSLRRRGKFWEQVAQDGTEVHWVPGTHYGMLRGDHARVLAEELRICLKRCAIVGES